MRNLKYILNEQGEPIEESDVVKWSQWLEDNQEKRQVARDTIGDVLISTVFLGLDHQFRDGPPILYETMIFRGEHDQYQDRYTTKQEALEGHKKALNLVKKTLI